MHRFPIRHRPRTFIALAALFLSRAAAPAAAQPTLQQRLDRLVESLERERVARHVPGMAFALVKDDQVLLCRGFGVADVETQRPVTEHTLFAAGSTTKAFTATLIGMLVDEGRMGWDEPPSRWLPAFHLSDEEADKQLAVRDLLCHRIGLATMTFLWYGNDVTRRELLECVGRARLLHPFRSQFNYSNLSYLAAGEAAGAAAGSDWDTLMAERLFTPLGMSRSNTTLAAAAAGDLALGYSWDAETDRLERDEMRDVRAVAPAGAINSCAADMARWVRFQLARGEIDGHRLISREQHEETWEPHIPVGGAGTYGLGWFLRDWNGRPVVEHAGGIDGFTAEVAMLPEEQLGFVLLMNLFASPLQETSRSIVFETMLGEWKDEAAPAVAEDFTPFLGTFMGNFAHFQDAEFKVLVQNERLAVDVPGQMIYELEPPDEEGRRRFSITDQIVVQFNRDELKIVTSMTIFQAGHTFELPRRAEGDAAAPPALAADGTTPLPSAEEVMALVHKTGGAENLSRLHNYRATGTVRFVHMGIEGTFEQLVDRDGRMRLEMDFGRFGRIRSAFTHERGWVDSSAIPFTEVHGAVLADMTRGHPLQPLRDWSEMYGRQSVRREEELDGRRVLVLRLEPRGSTADTIYVDRESGAIVRADLNPMSAMGIRVPTTVRYLDHRDVAGVRVPCRSESEIPTAGSIVVECASIEANVDVPEGAFVLEPEGRDAEPKVTQ